MSERRRVRVTESFFDQLDAVLGAERGAHGEPTATDFLVMEVPAIVERFATDFAGLPALDEDLPSVRLLIAPGVLVHALVVYGMLMADGSIELIGMAIQRQP